MNFAGAGAGVGSLVVAIAAVGAGAGCNIVSPADGLQQYIIRVDSLTAPASVAANDSLPLKFYGALPDGCHQYSHLEALVGPQRVEVTVFGTMKTGKNVACTLIYGIVSPTLKAPPPHTNPVTVVIHQPNGSELTRQIPVK